MTSSNENNFRVTGPLWGESTGHRWIPLTKASDAELWCFLWSAPEQKAKQTIETPVIWDAIALVMTSLQWAGEIGACSLVRHTTVSRIGFAILLPVWLHYQCHLCKSITHTSLRWRQNGRDSVSNHQPQDCLLNRLFRRRSKKTSKLRVTGLYEGNSPRTGEFPAQMASNAENISIWWRHHVCMKISRLRDKQESKT